MLKTCLLFSFLLMRSYDVKRSRVTSELFGPYKQGLPHKT